MVSQQSATIIAPTGRDCTSAGCGCQDPDMPYKVKEVKREYGEKEYKEER